MTNTNEIRVATESWVNSSIKKEFDPIDINDVYVAFEAGANWQSRRVQGEVVAYYDPRPGVDWAYRFLEPDEIEQEDNRNFFTVPLIANQPAPAASPEHKGDICDKCKRVYSCVHNVPNDVWAKIAPRPETLGEHNYGGGLLCPDCAATAAKEIGVHLIFTGEQWEEFPKPAKAQVPEGYVAIGKSNLITRREYGETASEAAEKMEQAGFYTYEIKELRII